MVSINTSLLKSINPLQYLQNLLQAQGKRVKTPTLLQMEAVECGAAALGIILGYYGRIVPLPELRRECGVSRDGSKASNVLKAARANGMEAKGFKKELDQLQELRPPYIVFWNFNHFLVLEGFGNELVYLNDPASGPRKVSRQEFDEGYTGVVLVMEPGPEFQKGGRKPSLILALWERLQGATGVLIYCLVAGFLLTLVGLAVPVFSQVFVDEILVQGRQHWLRPLLLAMAIATVLQGLLTLLRLRYLRRLKVKLSVGMSSRFLWHILRLPVSFYAQRFAGEISNRSSLNDQVADVLSGKLASTVIDALMVIFYALVMLQYDSVLTLVVVSFAAVNVFTLQWISRQRVDANQRLIQEYGKAAGASIAALQSIETIKASGLESDFFSRWSGYYAKAINSQQELGVTNQTFSVLPTLLSSLSSMALLVVGGLRVMDGHLSIGMLIAFQGLMQSFLLPVNNLVSFGSTLQEMEGNLIRLDDVLDNPVDSQAVRSQETGDRRQESGVRSQETEDRRQESGDRRQELEGRRQESGDRSQETGDRSQESGDRSQESVVTGVPSAVGGTPDLMQLPFSSQESVVSSQNFDVNRQKSQGKNSEENPSPDSRLVAPVSSSPDSSPPPLSRLQGYVELENITFGYSRLDPPLIENFSLKVKPGQRVALVGGSGSGKSTIAKLVSGLYEPWEGEIYFDGIPRNQIPQSVLTNSVAMVEQDISMFGGTVRDNLTLWDTTVSDKSLVRACRDAAIDDVVLSMSGGFDAELSEGAGNLSGGQRQRLEIARSLVNNPSILVMDEATSALDSETEKIIDQNLRRRGCTCIIVAHRLSTIRDCDEIIVLERGKVVQRGTHQELRQVEGAYSRLIHSES